MDVTVNVAFSVIDDVVYVLLIETVVTSPSIREDIRTALYISAHVTLERFALRVWYMSQPDFGGMTIKQTHHDCFSGPARASDFCLFVFVHVAGEAADKSFVCLNL